MALRRSPRSQVGSYRSPADGGLPLRAIMPVMVSLEADRYVPFEPQTPELVALRAELRQAISALEAGPGEILRASLAGALPPGADVKNALFYNLDGAAGISCSRHELVRLAPPLTSTLHASTRGVSSSPDDTRRPTATV